MHSHLHTKTNRGCDEVMRLLEECHAQGFLHKVMGNCNEAKRNVNRCLGQARQERSGRNREIARQERAKMKAIWQDIDENS